MRVSFKIGQIHILVSNLDIVQVHHIPMVTRITTCGVLRTEFSFSILRLNIWFNSLYPSAATPPNLKDVLLEKKVGIYKFPNFLYFYRFEIYVASTTKLQSLKIHSVHFPLNLKKTTASEFIQIFHNTSQEIFKSSKFLKNSSQFFNLLKKKSSQFSNLLKKIHKISKEVYNILFSTFFNAVKPR